MRKSGRERRDAGGAKAKEPEEPVEDQYRLPVVGFHSPPRANVFGVTLAVLLSGCASATPRVLTASALKAKPVVRADRVTDWDGALATAVAALERVLGTPRFEVTLHLYPGQDALEAALVASGYRADFARDTAGTMTAIGGYRSVLVNEANLATETWERRLGLVAHELTHSLQYELSGGHRGTSDQWLREGFAEWASVKVLAGLHAESVESRPHRARVELRRHPRDDLPPFAAMATFPQWVALGRGRQGGVLYEQALAAVDFLIRRHGLRRTLDYFGRFARSDDRQANFQAAFGEDLGAFEQAFRADVWDQR